MNDKSPPVGARFEFLPYRGARRIYELVQVLPVGAPATAERSASDRFKLKIVAETGFVASSCYGVGWEMWVELAWFTERTDARRVAA